MKATHAGAPAALRTGEADRQSGAPNPSWEERHARRQARSAQRVRVLPSERLTREGTTHGASVMDAAAFLVLVPRPLSWLKLQDLLYFAQAWHLVWDEELLFPEDIVAVEDGIRITEIDTALNGRFEVTEQDVRKGRPARLGESQKQTLSGIVKFYADRSHYRLSSLITAAEPWQAARVRASGTGSAVVLPKELHRYYRSLE